MLSKKYYNQLAEIFKFGYLDSYKTTYLENGNFDNNKIWYLTIDADVSNKFIENLDKKLKSISYNE